jgi:hypothetical protein
MCVQLSVCLLQGWSLSAGQALIADGPMATFPRRRNQIALAAYRPDHEDGGPHA